MKQVVRGKTYWTVVVEQGENRDLHKSAVETVRGAGRFAKGMVGMWYVL